MLHRSPKFYLGIVGALVAAGVVVTLTAAASGVQANTLAATATKPSASPGAAAKRQAYCDSFINHLASNLGKKPADVQKAASSALDQTLADAVKAGDLTQQQADAIKARQSGKQTCSGALAGLRPGGAGAHAGLPAYAKVLGISQQELKQDLASGKTVKDVAASKGMDEATFRNNLVNSVKSDLDAKVKAGKLTQQQEDNVLNRLKTGPLPLWDKPAKRAKAAPSPSATP
jgi:3-hydroxyacyl-CoA dehydrogenase